MLRRHEKIYSPAIGYDVDVLAFGHFGDPIIAFPSGGGKYFDFESNGMVGAIAPLIEAGRIKVYCPGGLDRESWLNDDLPPHYRAVRHNDYQDFIINNLVPTIRYDCRSEDIRIGLTGCSLGALHSANFALKFPHIFNYALCLSGLYDLNSVCGPSDSLEVYFNNPLAYVRNLHGAALDHIRHNTHITLVCGQGPWEDTNLPNTQQLADLLAIKGISHERDIWGHDVEHNWNWWRRQIVYHFGRRFG